MGLQATPSGSFRCSNQRGGSGSRLRLFTRSSGYALPWFEGSHASTPYMPKAFEVCLEVRFCGGIFTPHHLFKEELNIPAEEYLIPLGKAM